jgi:hypothetical protein
MKMMATTVDVESEEAQFQEVWKAFKAERNSKGDLLYPRAEELKYAMNQILGDGDAQTPEGAYLLAERLLPASQATLH